MKKITKLRMCNWSLLATTILALASGIQLEALPCGAASWVWLHIIICTIFMSLIIWHIALNKPKSQYTRKQKGTLWLGTFFLLTLISAIIATAHWIDTTTHSSTGGVHGKIGFIFIIAVTIHTIHHKKFFRLR